jgi:N-acyl-D-amino-acid deacylase
MPPAPFPPPRRGRRHHEAPSLGPPSLETLARRALLGAALLLVALPQGARAAQPDTLDLLLVGGRVIDGTGSVARVAEVGVRGDRVVFVGRANAGRFAARRRLDVSGLVVAPGFIDPHAHVLLDLGNAATSGLEGYLLQGVTSVITGNDGGGPERVAQTFARWTSSGLGPNAGVLVGHGTVRQRVMGMRNAPATGAALDSMRALVRSAMEQGAMGLSSGLYYAPGSFASTEEVAQLAREVAPFGGVYDTHMRDESSYTIGLLASVREAIAVGRDGGVPVHISHVKALGVDVWGRSDSVIAIVRAARAAGQAVSADQYPYLASGTGLAAAVLPRWAEAGGRDSLLARLTDAALAPRLRGEMTENLRRRGGATSLLITEARDTTMLGRTLADLAERAHADPVTTAIAILRVESPGVASFNMQQDDLDAFAVEPWVVTGSDGSGGHPRKYGAFAKAMRDFVVERPLLSLEAFVARSSAQTAKIFGLVDRGVLRDGAFADLIVFDPLAVRDVATFAAPTALATGMRWVFVNGEAVVADGRITAARPGRTLRPVR